MPILNMAQLANHYKIDRKLVRRTIAEHESFPYTPAPENNPGAGHRFDLGQVESWLLINDWSRGNTSYNPHIADRLEAEAEEKAHKQAAAGILPVPASIQSIRDKSKQKSNKADVQTALLQLELDRKRGRLVDRDEVIAEFAPKISRLAKGLELFPNRFGRKFNLTDAQIREVREYFDELRLALTRDEGGILSENYEAKSE